MRKINPQRVIARRKSLKLTQQDLADAAKISQQGVQFIENGKSARPRSMPELAKALKTTQEWLMGDGEDDRPQESKKPFALEVIGRIEAGAFREALELDNQDRQRLPVLADAYFAEYEQFLLEVIGTSMNRYYPEGSFVHCVRIEYSPEDIMPKDGDHVIVERRSGGLVEATCKEYVVNKGSAELWPRSHDPRHQTPISLNVTPLDEVQITALVIGSYTKRNHRGI